MTEVKKSTLFNI